MFPLHPLPFLHRVAVTLRELGAIVIENRESFLALGEHRVGNPFGIELPLNPAHHAGARHAVDFAGSSAVGEPVEHMERRIARSDLRLLCEQRARRGERDDGEPDMTHGIYMLTLDSVRC